MQLQLALELQDGSLTILNQPIHPKHLTASNTLMAVQHFPICIDSDSDDDDCGYAGGVDVCLDSEKEFEGMDENDEWSENLPKALHSVHIYTI